jgi:apurinic endonuclease APN1
MTNKLYLGIHLDSIHFESLLDAFEKATKLGANVLQIYLGNKHLTTLREKMRFTNDQIKIIKKYQKDNNIKFFIHAILTLNYCNDPALIRNRWGIDNLIYDVNLCKKLGGLGVIIHMGTHKTKKINITYDECLNNFINSIKIVLDNTIKIPIILETPVNRKNIVGGTIEGMSKIYNNIPINYQKRIGICVDTQHIFASGYDLRNIDITKQYFKKFDELIGINKLMLIHLNDSDKEFNSRIDRHQVTQKGFIFSNGGKESLQYIINYSIQNNIPLLLETKYDSYKDEIKDLKKLIINKIIGGNIKQLNKINKKDIKKLILKIFNKILLFHESLGKKGNISTKYRIDSYKKAIKSIENYKKPIYSSKDIKELDYIGKSFCNKINEISKTKTLKLYENIKKNKSTNSIETFQKIWGIGPKIAQNLINKKIYTIQNLKIAVKNKNIKLTEQQIIGLKYYNDLNIKIPRNEITEYTNIIKNLIETKNIKVYNAGSYRLGKQKSNDIDLIISFNNNINKDELKEKFNNLMNEKNIIKNKLVKGIHKNIYITKLPSKKYRQMDVAFIEEKYLPWYLLYFGSSRDFSKKIRNIASKMGYKLNEYGLYDKINGNRINFNPKTEKDIFDYLKLEYVVPENRK